MDTGTDILYSVTTTSPDRNTNSLHLQQYLTIFPHHYVRQCTGLQALGNDDLIRKTRYCDIASSDVERCTFRLLDEFLFTLTEDSDIFLTNDI